MTQETIITVEYAVTIIKTGRGWIAQVDDAHSPFDGIYAHGSTPRGALAALRGKIQDKQSR